MTTVKRYALWANILREARKLILNRRHRFLCHAIRDAVGYFELPPFHPMTRECSAMTDWVESLIGYSGSLDNWLRDRHGIDYYRQDSSNMRLLRLRWIDWMIQELERD